MNNRKTLILTIVAWVILPPCAIIGATFLWWWYKIPPHEGYLTWLQSPASKSMLKDLSRLLESVAPTLTALSAILTVVSILQQETSLHRCISRWLAAKTFFWVAVWLSYSTDRSIFWWSLDVAVLFWVMESSIELIVRIFIRYVLSPHRGYHEVLRPT